MQLHISDSCPCQKKISLEHTNFLDAIWNSNKDVVDPTNVKVLLFLIL